MYLDDGTVKLLRVILQAAGTRGATVAEVAKQLEWRLIAGVATEIEEMVSKGKVEMLIIRDSETGQMVGTRFAFHSEDEKAT